jgi:hypothetical protein
MKLPIRSRRQIALFHEPEEQSVTPENSCEALLQALADLLLEALGEKVVEESDEQGDACEHKNHG